MLPHERQKEILKQLYENRSVKITELTKYFNVTRETIRKDLYEMEEEDLIKKVHGGAILSKANHETDYTSRKSINDSEKVAIAKRAAELVENGDTIYIDYGTTSSYFVNEIMSKKNLTIVTASLPIAIELSDYTDFEVILIGGVIRKNEKSLYGPIAQRIIGNIFVDKGFFSAGGIDVNAGFTNFHMGEAEVSKLIFKQSQKKVMMADYSKFNTIAMNKVASLNEITVLITDDKTAEDVIADLKTKIENLFVVNTKEMDKDE